MRIVSIFFSTTIFIQQAESHVSQRLLEEEFDNGTRVLEIIPTTNPTTNPSASRGSEIPTSGPSFDVSTENPTVLPSILALPTTLSPSLFPTTYPSRRTLEPSVLPTSTPTTEPSNPTLAPTYLPSHEPTFFPSVLPTYAPTKEETIGLPTSPKPTAIPTKLPSRMLTSFPSLRSTEPSPCPMSAPTYSPIPMSPTSAHTLNPTQTPMVSTPEPALFPSLVFTPTPQESSFAPSTSPPILEKPTHQPTRQPFLRPNRAPTPLPTAKSTPEPTPVPTPKPTSIPTPVPTPEPTSILTPKPTLVPTQPSLTPTTRFEPSQKSIAPSGNTPTSAPTSTMFTTLAPSGTRPTLSLPSEKPSQIELTEAVPTAVPSTREPTYLPTFFPTSFPSFSPSLSPSFPTATQIPSHFPTSSPQIGPSIPPITQAPSKFPTKWPTSSSPSSSPTTSSPTISPAPSTLAPTLKPGLTLLPENLTLTLIKPASDVETIYLINLVDQPLRDLCISQWIRNEDQTIFPNYQVFLGDEVVAAKGEPGLPFDISNRVGRNSEEARLRIDSSGLARGVYELNLLAGELGGTGGCPAESDDPDYSGVARSVRVRLVVNTEADAEMTEFFTPDANSNLSYPVLGSSYHGLQILARDLDGLIVTTEPTDSFSVRLYKSGFASAISSCVVTAPITSVNNDPYYQVDCAIPLVEVSGFWQLTVSVKNTPAFTTNVAVLCRRGTYMDPADELCKPCLRNALCEYDGLTLGTIQLQDGYWRQSQKATNIYECEYDSVCFGAATQIDPDTGLVMHEAYGNSLCRNRKHSGILCQVCRGYSRYDSVAHRCLACDRKDGRLLRFILILVTFFIAACILGWIVAVCARKRGVQKDLSIFIRESVRYGSGDGGIRVLRKQQRLASSKLSERGDISSNKDAEDEKRLRRHLFIQRLKLSLLHKAKIIIAFAQIISAMPWVLNQIQYPPVFEAVASAFTFFDLHIVRLLTFECVFKKFNFYRVLIISTLLPILLSGLIALITLLRLNTLYNSVLLARLSKLRRYGFISNSGSQDSDSLQGDGVSTVTSTLGETPTALQPENYLTATRDRARKIISQAAFVFLLLTFLIFPGCSTLIFQFFACTTFRESQVSGESRRVLQVDYSVTCASPAYRRMTAYALLAMMIYPIGIPLLYFVLLWGMRKRINPSVDENHVLDHIPLSEEDKNFLITAGHELTFVKQLVKVHKRDQDPSISHLSFIYEEYEPRTYLFSIVDCVRKLCLSGILVFLYPGSLSQVGFALLFALIFAKVQTHVRPFLEDEDDLIAEVVMESLVIFFFLSLMLYVSKNRDDNARDTNAATKAFAPKVFGAVFITMLVVLLLLAIYVVLLEVFGYETIATKFRAVLSNDKRKIVRAISKNADIISSDSFSSHGSVHSSKDRKKNSHEQKQGDDDDTDLSPASGSDVIRPASFVSDDEEKGHSTTAREYDSSVAAPEVVRLASPAHV